MSLSHRYRNFGSDNAPVAEEAESISEEIEDLKLQAFETGYQAGWDDATKAQATQKDKISTELAQNLLDMSFTYHEALSKLTGSLETTMCQVVEKLLPDLVQSALSSQILEQVKTLLGDQIGQKVVIIVHPQNLGPVQNTLANGLPEPFEISGDDSLGEGQAFVRFGTNERQVDLDSIIQKVSKAMTAFFHETSRENIDG